MSKKTKIWLIVAAAVLVVGGAIFVGVMASLGWDFSALSTVSYVTNEHKIDTFFRHITVQTDTADVVFVPSENSEAKVICYEQRNAKHAVSVENGTLTVKLEEAKKIFGVNTDTPKITVEIPAREYSRLLIEVETGDVEIPGQFRFTAMNITGNTGNVTSSASGGQIKIKTTTGDIIMRNVNANVVDLEVTTGDVQLTNISSDAVKANGGTGNLMMAHVVARNALTAVRTTGNIRLEQCDGGQVKLKTNTGNIMGSLLTGKTFKAKSESGDVEVPESAGGGTCQVESGTGDIRLEIKAN